MLHHRLLFFAVAPPLFATTLGLLVALSTHAEAPPGPASAVTLLEAPHGAVGDFFNPWQPFDGSVWKFLEWKLFTKNPFDKSMEPEVPRVENDGSELAGFAAMPRATWVGHATFAVHDGDDVFLTDPHFGPRALTVKRVTPPGLPLSAIPGDAFAVISHNHYDHLDAHTVEALPASVQWFVPLGLADWFRERDRPNVVELDWWQSAQRGRWTITCLPSQHWSRRFDQGMNESLWCSWLIDSGETKYYFAGDTGYFAGFEEFGRRFGPIDIAMLPIGAYEPRFMMQYQHMNPAEAYRAFGDLGARHLLGMHWGTFDLTDEPLDEPPKALREAVRAAEGDLRFVHTLALGETFDLPESDPPAALPGIHSINPSSPAARLPGDVDPH